MPSTGRISNDLNNTRWTSIPSPLDNFGQAYITRCGAICQSCKQFIVSPPHQCQTEPVPVETGGETMSLIDEKQVELLDSYRAARDAAHRHFESKRDRATLMRIQADALVAEGAEGIEELNESMPLPSDD